MNGFLVPLSKDQASPSSGIIKKSPLCPLCPRPRRMQLLLPSVGYKNRRLPSLPPPDVFLT